MNFIYRNAKRVIIAVVGVTVMLVGVVMLVTPGPAFVLIPAGLAILATEFVWAKRLLQHVKQEGLSIAKSQGGRFSEFWRRLVQRIRGQAANNTDPDPPAGR